MRHRYSLSSAWTRYHIRVRSCRMLENGRVCNRIYESVGVITDRYHPHRYKAPFVVRSRARSAGAGHMPSERLGDQEQDKPPEFKEESTDYQHDTDDGTDV
jgi:hypothetical protein